MFYRTIATHPEVAAIAESWGEHTHLYWATIGKGVATGFAAAAAQIEAVCKRERFNAELGLQIRMREHGAQVEFVFVCKDEDGTIPDPGVLFTMKGADSLVVAFRHITLPETAAGSKRMEDALVAIEEAANEASLRPVADMARKGLPPKLNGVITAAGSVASLARSFDKDAWRQL